jgi:hypothetical protein
MRSHLAPSLLTLAAIPTLAGCGTIDEIFSPSLTQIRIGEVEVAEPPPIPDDRYLPGIVAAPEDYEYPEEGEAVPFVLDTSRMDQIRDPKALKEHEQNPYATAPGALFDEKFERDVEYDDVQQGAIGDCYFVAALSAALYTDADRHIREGLVREVHDDEGFTNHFAVRFYDGWGKPQDIAVDADLVRRDGKPLYARSADSGANDEEWAIGLIEKAYAKWHGSFEKIGNGGYAGDVLQALTGSSATYRETVDMKPDSIYAAIDEAMAENRPVVACTFSESDGVNYDGLNIYADHCYSVHGVKTQGDAQIVTLRNPWGDTEPAGNGPDDGIFDLEMSEFIRLYQMLSLGGGTAPDVKAPSAVTTIEVAGVGDGTLAVTWYASGDDARTGLAANYDVRVSTSMITAENFYQATQVPAADPQSPGTYEELELTQLTNGTRYYVAVKVLDEAGNTSPMSKVVNGVPGGPARRESGN